MKIEIRADGSLHIEGYVNAVERDSRTVICPECGKCVEHFDGNVEFGDGYCDVCGKYLIEDE